MDELTVVAVATVGSIVLSLLVGDSAKISFGPVEIEPIQKPADVHLPNNGNAATITRLLEMIERMHGEDEALVRTIDKIAQPLIYINLQYDDLKKRLIALEKQIDELCG